MSVAKEVKLLTRMTSQVVSMLITGQAPVVQRVNKSLSVGEVAKFYRGRQKGTSKRSLEVSRLI